MTRIGIVAALEGELKPLVQGWTAKPFPHGGCYTHIEDDLEIVAVYAGVGREAAGRACMQALEEGALAGLVSVGWAGALSASLAAGVAYRVTDVVDGATGERYMTEDAEQAPERVKLVTTKRILRGAEKQQAGEDFGAVLVDMEAATVARLARVRQVPFYCYKAVSDTLHERLPDMNPFVREGQFETTRFVASVLLRPQYWPRLMSMGRNSRRGAIALAQAVNEWKEERRIGDRDSQ